MCCCPQGTVGEQGPELDWVDGPRQVPEPDYSWFYKGEDDEGT